MPARSQQYSFREKAVFVARAILCNENVAALCHKKGISSRTYYNWRKCFIKVCEQIMAENSALACLRQRQITKDISGYITELRHAAIERQRLDRHRIKAQTSNKVDHLRSRHESEIELMNFVENVALSKVETLKIAGLPRATYYRWRKRLAATGKIKDLRERSNKVRTKDRDDVKECLFRILHSPPSDYGFNRTTWKHEDLRTALAQSGITLSLNNV
jgi:transposase-like protein